MRPKGFLLLLLALSSSIASIDVSPGVLLTGNYRQLQGNAQGFYRNLIGSVEVSSFEENKVLVDVIYVVAITSGSLTSIKLNMFNPKFGTPNISTLSVFLDEEKVTLRNDSISLTGGSMTISLILERQRQEFVVRASFIVDNMICQLGDTQAIPGTWLAQLDNNIQTQNAELDFTIPLVSPLPDPFQVDITPGSDRVIEDTSNSGFLTVFIPYDVDDLGFMAAEDSVENMFFSLGANVFETAPQCPENKSSNLFLIVVLAIPAVACCCLCGLALLQRYFDSVADRRAPRTRLNLFPGNPDIILAPNSNVEQTTVRAVLEEDDPQEFDAAVPINTIDVNVDTQPVDARRRAGSSPISHLSL